jgi:UDP-perosamine 4-acetyltransferase
MIDVVGLGGGGHARVVIEILTLLGNYSIKGVLDPALPKGVDRALGVEVLGDDQLLDKLVASGTRTAFIGVGGVRETDRRRRVYEFARASGCVIVQAVHPGAVVSSSAVLGDGVTIMAGAIVNAASVLGDNVTLNTGAIVEHDCEIADHCHVATGARLGGGVKVETGAHIGIGAVIRQGITIGAGALVGAGAVVVSDVPAKVIVVGNPARVMRQAEP